MCLLRVFSWAFIFIIRIICFDVKIDIELNIPNAFLKNMADSEGQHAKRCTSQILNLFSAIIWALANTAIHRPHALKKIDSRGINFQVYTTSKSSIYYDFY